jgi:hypothetical protein
MRWNRLAAIAGITYFLLAFVEFFGPSFPHASDTANMLDSYFVMHRSWTLTTVIIEGLGNAIWIVFLCGIALLLRRAGSQAAAAVTLVGGALNVAISLTGLASIAAIAFQIAGSGDPTTTKAFFTLASMTLVLSNFMLALMASAVAAAPLARWFRYASALTAIVFALGGTAFARHGTLSPDGALQFATYALELLWTLAASILLLRTDPTPTARPTAPAAIRHQPAKAGASTQPAAT